ncbi:MAG: VOC family protein [Nannocystaceae bacterium]
MAIRFNHTIVASRDRERSARFLTELFALPPAARGEWFEGVELADGVALHFEQVDPPIQPQHYAFLVSEEEFTAIYGRIVDRRVDHWADPARSRPGAINHDDGGRGVYFVDPDGHLLEILTRPYGSGG